MEHHLGEKEGRAFLETILKRQQNCDQVLRNTAASSVVVRTRNYPVMRLCLDGAPSHHHELRSLLETQDLR